MPIIHVTERRRFKNCRRAWQYSDKIGLKKIKDDRNALWLGRGVHTALAGYYSGQNEQDAFDEWLEKTVPQPARDAFSTEEFSRFHEMIDLATTMIAGYIQFAKQSDTFEVISVEKKLSAKIPGTKGTLVGTIDLLVRQGGRLWVYDHKTCASFIDPQLLDLDDQMTSYLWLVWKTYGEMPAGAVYNQLRKKIPAEPYLLKSGKSLSKDKSIDTTYKKYYDAILTHGFNPEDYEDTLIKIAEKKFYCRELVPRNKNELGNFEQHLVDEYREMASKNTPIYSNPTRDCSWCDYLCLCKAENEGGDVQSLKDGLFVVEPGKRL